MDRIALGYLTYVLLSLASMGTSLSAGWTARGFVTYDAMVTRLLSRRRVVAPRHGGTENRYVWKRTKATQVRATQPSEDGAQCAAGDVKVVTISNMVLQRKAKKLIPQGT